MKTMIQVELIGRDIVLCLEEDLPDSVLRQPGFNSLEEPAANSFSLQMTGDTKLVNVVFRAGIPVLDISHGKGDKLISVKVSEGQGIALPGQIRDIGIQLIPVAPVVIPRFIGEYIPEKLRNDLPVRDSQFSQFHKGAPW